MPERPVDSLYLDIRARGEKLIGDVDRAMRNVEARVHQTGQKLKSIGQSLTLKLGAPAAAMSAGIITAGAEFEEAMNRVNANAQATKEELEGLHKIAREIGSDVKLPGMAVDAANAMDILARNGLKAAQLLDKEVTVSMIRLAKATGGDFGQSADIATDAVAQFDLELSKLGNVANQITGVTLNSKFAIQDYAFAISQGGSVASAAGVSFEDFNATLAATASMFAKGGDAGTSLKTFMQRLQVLQDGNDEGSKLMRKYGIEVFDAAGNMRSMADIAQSLQDGLLKLSEAERGYATAKIFGSDASRTALGLMKAGKKGIDEMTASIAKASTQENLERRLAGYTGALQKFRKTLNSTLIDFAEAGVLKRAAGKLEMFTKGLNKLQELSPGMKQLVGNLLLLGVVIGPVLIGLGIFMTLLSPIASGLGVLAAIAAVALGALVLSWTDFKAALEASGLKEKLGQVAEQLRAIGIDVPTFAEFEAVISKIKDAFGAWGEKLGGVIEKLKGLPWGKIAAGVGIIFVLQKTFGSLIPVIQTLLTIILASVGVFAQLFSVMLSVGKVVIRFLGPIGIAITVIGSFIYAMRESSIVAGAVSGTLKLLGDVFKMLWAEVKTLIASLDQTFESIGGIVGVAKIAVFILGALIAAVIVGTAAILALAVALGIGLLKAFNSVLEGARDFGEFLGTVLSEAILAVKQFYDAAVEFLDKKLGAVWSNVKNGVQAVGDKFAWLYDVVVGNSWIPDMVDRIIQEGKRLKDRFFTTTTKDIEGLEGAFARFNGTTLRGMQDALSEWREELDNTPIGSEKFKQLSKDINAVEKDLFELQSVGRDFTESLNLKKEAFTKIRDDLTSVWDGFIDGTIKAKNIFKEFASAYLRDIAKMIGEQAILNGLKSASASSLGSSIGSIFSGLLGFADGGRPPLGVPSVVGEEGPELFVPDRSGTVIPNHIMRGINGSRGESVSIVMPQTFQAGLTETVLRPVLAQWKNDIIETVVSRVESGGSYRRRSRA